MAEIDILSINNKKIQDVEARKDIKTIKENQIKLIEDDTSMEGISDSVHDTLTTNDKTIIGGINELNSQFKDIAKQTITTDERTKLNSLENYDDTTIKNDIQTQKARIDTFTSLQNGSTTGDAELIDARIGADGITYTNLGDSIRTQCENINDDIINVIGCNLNYNYNYTSGGYINNTDGTIISYDNWEYTDFIPIENKVKSFKISTTMTGSYSYNAFYDENKQFISNFTVDSQIVDIPSNAKYFRLSKTVNANTIIKNVIESLNKKCNKDDVKKISSLLDDDLINLYIGAKSNSYHIDWSTGGYIDNTNGNLVTHDSWKYTDFIKLDENVKQLELSTTLTGSYSYNAFYDENKQFISNFTVDSPIVDVPSNAKYVRLSVDKDSTTSIKNKIGKLIDKCDLKDITNIMSNNSSIIYLNKDIESFVLQASEGLGQMFKESTKPLTFTHFSDIHTRQELWDRVVEYNNYYKNYIKFSIHTGDFCGGNRLSCVDLYANGKNSEIPLYNCVGNHDTYLEDNSTGDKKTTHDLLFNHITNWNVNFCTTIDNPMTYHKDFSDNKIRLIVLDYYYDIDAQCNWLLERLNGAKSLGYHVITCMHEMSNTITQKLETTFQTRDNFEKLGGNKNSKSKFDKVIGDWIKNGGVHVANFAGHEHSDFIGYTDNGVLNICVQASTDNTIWTDAKRVKNTKTWDCFNVVSIEQPTGILKLIRVGNNADHYLREKKIFVYDYINKKIII